MILKCIDLKDKTNDVVLKYSEDTKMLATEIKCLIKLNKAYNFRQQIQNKKTKNELEDKKQSQYSMPKVINYGVFVFQNFKDEGTSNGLNLAGYYIMPRYKDNL